MWGYLGARSIVKRQALETSHTNADTASLHKTEKSTAGGAHDEERINGVLHETFRPFAFTTIVARGGAMELVTLSPHAFVTEVANAEALVVGADCLLLDLVFSSSFLSIYSLYPSTSK